MKLEWGSIRKTGNGKNIQKEGPTSWDSLDLPCSSVQQLLGTILLLALLFYLLFNHLLFDFLEPLALGNEDGQAVEE